MSFFFTYMISITDNCEHGQNSIRHASSKVQATYFKLKAGEVQNISVPKCFLPTRLRISYNKGNNIALQGSIVRFLGIHDSMYTYHAKILLIFSDPLYFWSL